MQDSLPIASLKNTAPGHHAFSLGLWLAFAFAPSVAHSAEPSGIIVPLWQPHDFAFTAEARVDNPFLVRFTATVTGPEGRTFDSLGFHDGDNTWKVRVAANQPGEWTLVTHSELPELDGKRAAFTCAANANKKIHGVLRVDPGHKHHFIFEDGTRFFMLGYECDWLWALDTRDPKLGTVRPFLDKLAKHGFNYVILNTYAHDTGWRKGRTGDDDFGPPPLYAWGGTNEHPDHSRLNLAYWQHYDRVIHALLERGMMAHLFVKVYNKKVKWPARGSVEDDLFFRWIVARYAAYPNVVWDFSKEAHNEKDLDYKLGRLRFLRASDPYHHLMTNHDDDDNNDRGVFDTLNDFRTDQQHSKLRETILAQRQRRAWPVANVEFGYEQGPGGPEDKTYDSTHTPEELVRRAWEISMAGGYTAYYYTFTAWDVLRPDDTPTGYTYFRHLREFFESTRYWEMAPAENLASDGWTLANPGREYVVFLQKAGPLTLSSSRSAALDESRMVQSTDSRAGAGWTYQSRNDTSSTGKLARRHGGSARVGGNRQNNKNQLFRHNPEGFQACLVAEYEGRQEPCA